MRGTIRHIESEVVELERYGEFDVKKKRLIDP
jgi:hypothetical protein